MISEHTELRAERLRVTLSMFGVVHTDFASAYDDAAKMSAGEHALFQSTNRDDLALSNSCLEIEHGLRRRGWRALETLLAAIPPGGDLEDVYGLPAAQVCGWLSEAGA